MKLKPVKTSQDNLNSSIEMSALDWNFQHAAFGIPNAEGTYVCNKMIISGAGRYYISKSSEKYVLKGRHKVIERIRFSSSLLPSSTDLCIFLSENCPFSYKKNIISFISKEDIEDFDHSTYSQQTAYIYYNHSESKFEAVDYQLEAKDLLFTGNEEYKSGCLKDTLHGVVYQLKLLMLFLSRSCKEQYHFDLATERDDAGKFDDVVLEYHAEGDSDSTFRYLQAKHKQNSTGTCITFSSLLPKQASNTEKTGEFSLIKYFNSYRQIKENVKKQLEEKAENNPTFKEKIEGDDLRCQISIELENGDRCMCAKSSPIG